MSPHRGMTTINHGPTYDADWHQVQGAEGLQQDLGQLVDQQVEAGAGGTHSHPSSGMLSTATFGDNNGHRPDQGPSGADDLPCVQQSLRSLTLTPDQTEGPGQLARAPIAGASAG